jgi:hypothetical protein
MKQARAQKVLAVPISPATRHGHRFLWTLAAVLAVNSFVAGGPAVSQVQPLVPASVDPGQDTLRKKAIQLIGNKADPGRRYMDICIGPAPVRTDYPGYEGLPVKRCVYRSDDLTSVVWSVMPKSNHLADWVTAACRAVPADKALACVDFFLNAEEPSSLWQQNGASFIVKGFVNESSKGAGCDGPAPARILFLDGISARESLNANFCRREPMSIEAQERASDPTAPVYYFVARPSSVSLLMVENAIGRKFRADRPVHKTRGPYPSPDWPRMNRHNFVSAMSTGVDQFMIFRAQAEFGSRQ